MTAAIAFHSARLFGLEAIALENQDRMFLFLACRAVVGQ